MKSIFVGPQGIRPGWRFAIFVFLLFTFSKLFFQLLTILPHYQEHPGWFPTNLLLDGALSFAAALLAGWIMSKLERRAFAEYGLPWRAMFPQAFLAGHFVGLRRVLTHGHSPQTVWRGFVRGVGIARANKDSNDT